MEGLVKRGLLRGRTDMVEWLVPGHEEIPTPPDSYVVSFAPFHEHGFMIPSPVRSGAAAPLPN